MNLILRATCDPCGATAEHDVSELTEAQAERARAAFARAPNCPNCGGPRTLEEVPK